jgi:hypothetical protein
MNFFKKYFCFLPLILILAQLSAYLTYNFSPSLDPSSSQNTYLNQLFDYFHTAKINPINLTVLDFQNEVNFYLQNRDLQSYFVIFSTQKDALKQVTALQKLIQIANIKGSDIKFIDLSSPRPYATF